MGTFYRKVNNLFSSVGSTRLISVPTSPATKIVLSSGFTAMVISNVGQATLAWGDTSVTASSGNLLFYSMNEKLNSLTDDFFFYVIADSAAGKLAVSEYK